MFPRAPVGLTGFEPATFCYIWWFLGLVLTECLEIEKRWYFNAFAIL
jgi:hypothetical protein